MNNHIDIVFDSAPGPEGARFIEVEDSTGKSIKFGEWVQRPDGYWALRLPAASEAKIVAHWVPDAKTFAATAVPPGKAWKPLYDGPAASEAGAVPVAYWAAIRPGEDGELVYAVNADDANGGDMARDLCNQFINGELNNGRPLLRLVALYDRPAPVEAGAVPDDDTIEALAKKHIAKGADQLRKVMPDAPSYQQTEQFKRIKALVFEVLSTCAAPSDAPAQQTEQERRACLAEDALADLLNQIRKTAPVDDHGHKLTMNMAYLKAVELLNQHYTKWGRQ